MNETKKTGIFWGVAAVVALIATIVSWPAKINEDGGESGDNVGLPLFAEFSDPLAAASLKIVTFDEAQGELKNFEVRRDVESGLWTIPSKGGYPADAIEQMRDAANALVGLTVLDMPTENPEDHVGMGVVEPKLEDLEPGDEGVGRLVTFKDSAQKVLASLIVGGEVKGQQGQVYVRKPGQDPVYVVKLDDQPLSTNFTEWIEEDLLQLSSIDVENVELKDYNASLGLQGVSLVKNYDVALRKEGSEWKLDSLKEYDKSNPLSEPTEVAVDADKSLNTQKLNDLANALDDLKFVDVNRKPEGISANLKADKDFAADQEAASQLAGRGFIPVPLGPNREIEILSANGEMTATTKDGVQYILRFGNISGIADEAAADQSDPAAADGDAAGGVNRYLMVSTVVDESKFPVPELTPIPQTLEELEAMEKPQPPAGVEFPAELNAPESTDAAAAPAEQNPVQASEQSGEQPEMKAAATEPDPAAEAPAVEAPATDGPNAESPADDATTTTAEPPQSGETEASGEGSSTTVGEAQEPQGADESTEPSEPGEETAAPAPQATTEEPAAEPAPTSPAAENAAPEAAQAASDASEAAMPAEPELTEEEKLEQLAAVQEKITKENERKLEDRKEKMERARLQSQALNERFADWYYVIPEATYSKLRISREELFESADAASMPNPASLPPGFPNMQIPGGFGN